MVKKGGRDLNPMDAFKKSQKAKEIAKHKKGRQFQREALSQTSNPAALRAQLKEVLDAEEAGDISQELKMKKKALQLAYDQAFRKKIEEENKARQLKQQQESDLAHPSNEGDPSSTNFLPPLPPMPPPLGPPPSFPGSYMHSMPPRIHDPSHNNNMMHGPAGMLPPPAGPPPISRQQQQQEREAAVAASQPVISAKSTVVQLPKAHHDEKVISMVPASLLAKRPRQNTAFTPHARTKAKAAISSAGFGLLPTNIHKKDTVSTSVAEKNTTPESENITTDADGYDEFMKSMKELGAVE